MVEYEVLRAKHTGLFRELLPEYLGRLTWNGEQIRRHQTNELRRILRTAKGKSPWHRQRLSSFDAENAQLSDLASIPSMTKEDLMANFDAILTDRRLSQDLAESHLESLTDDAYLLDEFHVVASGGSSGRRGVFVYGWEAWAVISLTVGRFRQRLQYEMGPTAVRATVAAGGATHISYAMPRTFRDFMKSTAISATLPLSEIVDRLNALRPDILTGYPSILYALSGEAVAGRLLITPRVVVPIAEPLLPEMRRAMEEAWHCQIMNSYGASEGVAAGGCGQAPGMHLGEDVAIFELVDEAGAPVPQGTPAAKMYITNLFNHVQPLIRYELTDEAMLIDEPCVCGCAMRRIDDIEGRSDDLFVYESARVHPLVFRSRLGSDRNIVEYQVHQTPQGAELTVRTNGPIDAASLAQTLERDLERAGLQEARVTIRNVDSFDRQRTGKLKRFFPTEGSTMRAAHKPESER